MESSCEAVSYQLSVFSLEGPFPAAAWHVDARGFVSHVFKTRLASQTLLKADS